MYCEIDNEIAGYKSTLSSHSFLGILYGTSPSTMQLHFIRVPLPRLHIRNSAGIAWNRSSHLPACIYPCMQCFPVYTCNPAWRTGNITKDTIREIHFVQLVYTCILYYNNTACIYMYYKSTTVLRIST